MLVQIRLRLESLISLNKLKDAGLYSTIGSASVSRVKRSQVPFPVWPHTYKFPSADSRRAAVSYWRKYVHLVLVTCLRGLNLARNSVVRLTDRPDMTLAVYHKAILTQTFYLYIRYS